MNFSRIIETRKNPHPRPVHELHNGHAGVVKVGMVAQDANSA